MIENGPGNSTLVTLRGRRAAGRPVGGGRPDDHAVPQPGYVGDLAAALRDQLEGEVRFDTGSRAAYSTDASNYRQVPIGVVVPRTVEDVERTVACCRAVGAPLTSRGGGTSLAGQACNTAVVIDYSKYLNEVLEVDPERQLARVEPGCVLDDLRDRAARFGLTYGPDPATHDRNTLGGMIGNNSCGVHSVMADLYGPGPLTRHQVRRLSVLTYDGARFDVGRTPEAELDLIVRGGGRRGEIYRALRDLRDRYADLIRTRYPSLPRRVSGYNLDALLPENGFDVAQALVGTEGTCVAVLEATVQLIEAMPARALVVLGYPDVFHAADHVPEIMARRPVGLEAIDQTLVHNMDLKGMHEADLSLLPDGDGWLLVEFGGRTDAEAVAGARRLMAELARRHDAPSAKLMSDAGEAARLWALRESALGATAHVPGQPKAHPGWEDAAVPPDRLGEYLREFHALLERFDYHAALYGHFGQGCVHCRIDFDFSSRLGVSTWLAFLDQASDLVVRYGGSLSGEHGDGQARAAFLSKMFGDELVGAFREFKAIWDPEGRMNPGRIVDPYQPEQHLRVGPQTRFEAVETHFRFPADQGSFARAVDRCVGVGKCRRSDGGTMCPSYMVTREEEHSTRGRARLLFEMMRGLTIRDGWRSDAVREALDLCLACKGCKHDCPVDVDMATYKAEFLSHYYEGRLRPRTAYGMGRIHRWARLASPLAPVVNALARTEPFAGIVKWIAGIAPERRIPPLARPTLRRWFERRPASRNDGRPRVMLWPDTFTNYLEPSPGQAAVRVLEAAGWRVELPPAGLCCGRPLYDWGMLDEAKRLWRRNLEALAPALDDDVPIVGVEPSCVAAFRDELPNLFPDDDRAGRLRDRTRMLGEFLRDHELDLGAVDQPVLVQGHCHHRSVLDFDADVALLRRMSDRVHVLDSGCCGMAGAFGFERGKYDVSVAAAERVLLPAVRSAGSDALVVANGFSCRQQLQQLEGRRALHLAEVLDRALAGEARSAPALEEVDA